MANAGGHVSDKDIYSTHDAARICRVTPMTVIRWIEEGRIPAFKTAGGHRRILRSDLLAFCKERGIPLAALAEPSNGRVLCVGVEPAVREVVHQMARALDPEAQVDSAGDLFDAGRLVATHRPDVAFIDVNAPGLDPLDLCARLTRGRGGFPPVQVVALLDAESAEMERTFRARGAMAVLEKPPADMMVTQVLRATFKLPEDARGDAACVLIVDDDVAWAESLRSDLEEASGARVIVCETATDGLLAAGSERPDVILLDLELPGLDPLDAVRRIRQRLPGGQVIILGVLDRGADAMRGPAVAVGAREVVGRNQALDRVLACLPPSGPIRARGTRPPLNPQEQGLPRAPRGPRRGPGTRES